MGLQGAVSRFKSALDHWRQTVRRRGGWITVAALVARGFILALVTDRVAGSTNEWLDTWIGPSARWLMDSIWGVLRAPVVGVLSVIALVLLGLFVHAYIETRPKAGTRRIARADFAFYGPDSISVVFPQPAINFESISRNADGTYKVKWAGRFSESDYLVQAVNQDNCSVRVVRVEPDSVTLDVHKNRMNDEAGFTITADGQEPRALSRSLAV